MSFPEKIAWGKGSGGSGRFTECHEESSLTELGKEKKKKKDKWKVMLVTRIGNVQVFK